MKGLLLRNLYTLRIPVLIAAAIVLILSMSGSSSAAFVIPFAAMGIAVLPCPLFAADAQSRFESYRLTLPVKRRTIADAYYLTVLLLTVILLLFSLLMLLRNQMDLKLYYLSNLVRGRLEAGASGTQKVAISSIGEVMAIVSTYRTGPGPPYSRQSSFRITPFTFTQLPFASRPAFL